MAEAVRMPKSGISVESCLIGTWKKHVGDRVGIGNILFDYETDKAAFECESTAEGLILEIFYQDGDEVEVLRPVCAIGAEGEDISAIRAEAGIIAQEEPRGDTDIPAQEDDKDDKRETQPGDATDTTPRDAQPGDTTDTTIRNTQPGDATDIDLRNTQTDDTTSAVPHEAALANDATSVTVTPGAQSSAGDGDKVSPRARSAADRLGLYIGDAVPTGPDGRIIERDVMTLAASGNASHGEITPEESVGASLDGITSTDAEPGDASLDRGTPADAEPGDASLGDGTPTEADAKTDGTSPDWITIAEVGEETGEEADGTSLDWITVEEVGGTNLDSGTSAEADDANLDGGTSAEEDDANLDSGTSAEADDANLGKGTSTESAASDASLPSATAPQAPAGSAAAPGSGTGVTQSEAGGIDRSAQSAPEPDPALAIAGPFTDGKFTKIRSVIASSMLASLQNTAQLTHHHSFDATEVRSVRNAFKGSGHPALASVSIGDMVLFAVVRTLVEHPDMNAHLVNGNILRKFEDVNLGVAVDTPRGLMVPTVFAANKKSLTEISAEVKQLAADARQGNINPDLLQGGSFTVSNLGPTGVEIFTPILNPPQVGIFGVCGVTTKVKQTDEGIVTYPSIGMSLTYDHRAVDGAPASRFAQAVCEKLAQFSLLLDVS
ncbi:MAG: 2-oxo acid dehydrogenase subunit E2 [Clostridiales Family XIII bacterium]|nr:2-oxo acid dehydrogenase subunit E2 [Clostridiales Family XIII bacterium]